MAETSYVIGFANLDDNNPFTRLVGEHFEAEIARFPDLSVMMRTNNLNTERAMANVREFCAHPVDLAIIFHVDDLAGTQLVMPFHQQRIPIVCIDIPLSTAIFFGTDVRTAGKCAGTAMGEWVRDNWQSQIDRVLVMTEPRTLDVFKLRFDSALDSLADVVPYPSESVFYLDNGADADISRQRVASILNTWPDDRHIVIICMNDKIAEGVLKGVREVDRESDVAVLSYDGTQVALDEFRRPDSRLIVSPSFRADEYGRQLVELSRRILSGERVPRRNYVQPICVTRENYAGILGS